MSCPSCLFLRRLVAFGFLALPCSAAFGHQNVTTPSSAAKTGSPESQTVIREVVVTGANAIHASDVTAAARRAVGQAGNAQALRDAVTDVLGLYRRRGFIMAQVTDAEVTSDGQLRISVAEGVIRQVILRGNRRTRARTIRAVLSIQPGQAYQEAVVRADREKLARLGIFADVSITPRVPGTPEPLDDTDVNKIEVTPPPVDPIGEGKTASPPDTPAPAPPAPTPPSQGETAEGTAKSSDTAEAKLPDAEPIVAPEDVGVVDVVVRIKESPTANIAATLGYTDNIGAVGFVDLSEANFLGTAQRVTVQWQRTAATALSDDGSLVASGSRSAFGFSYDTPALRRSDVAFGGEIYDKNTVFLPYFAGGRETIRSYEKRRGGRLRVGRALFGPFAGFITVRHDRVGYDALPERISPPIYDVLRSEGTVGALGFGLVADKRDQIGSPQSGYLHSFTLEAARPTFGGTFTFTQATVDLRQYTSLSSRRFAPNGKDRVPVPVLATRLYGGAATGYVPLSELFYLGGYDLLRGYDLYSLRGETAALGTAELRLPVGQGLQAVAFTDIGGVWEPTRAFSPDVLKVGVGAGLRFLSPIGPIRLDAAYGNHLQTYVSLGQSF